MPRKSGTPALISIGAPAGAPTGGAPDPRDGPPCHLCPAHCCQYFALQIDAPRTPREHDQVRWFLLHRDVVVWVQDGDWYLEVRNTCRHLQPDRRCGIYETRPQVCRDYGLPDSDEGPCEFFTQDGTYDHYFADAEAFSAWSRRELERRERRLARRRERYRRARELPEVREAAG
jgi:Fe-S-cluster containining protein